jgi:A/G-specific adenine glycosylase
VRDFARKLIAWQRRHGRRNLPWQGTRDPYRIWVSEIMLQQTRLETVIPYYKRFLARFPDLGTLASAPEEQILELWSGLGYYARARHLHRAARTLVAGQGSRFPTSTKELQALPGIGRSTAGAIAVFAFGARAAILDGNVRRVLARVFAVEGEKAQWELAGRLVPARGTRAYAQGLMDLGATVCTRADPGCARCPLALGCVARREKRIGELPAPRRRAEVPTRKATWLVLVHRGQVLLEKRPPSGLWGGLWTFPEAGRTGVESLGCRIGTRTALPAFEHAFTHFRLRVRPVLCRVRGGAARAERTGRAWLDVADAIGGAVPAPVRSLLQSLASPRWRTSTFQSVPNALARRSAR